MLLEENDRDLPHACLNVLGNRFNDAASYFLGGLVKKQELGTCQERTAEEQELASAAAAH